MHTIYLGIDPGISGAMVALSGSKIQATLMPSTPGGIFNWLSDYSPVLNQAKVIVTLEQVGGYVSNNPQAAIGSAMFEFGKNYGFIHMALIASYLDPDLVVAAVWQRKLGVPPRHGKPKNVHKRWMKQLAQQLFPRMKVTGKVADALLIAEYGRRKHRGEL